MSDDYDEVNGDDRVSNSGTYEQLLQQGVDFAKMVQEKEGKSDEGAKADEKEAKSEEKKPAAEEKKQEKKTRRSFDERRGTLVRLCQMGDL